jgi:hypothetical protein
VRTCTCRYFEDLLLPYILVPICPSVSRTSLLQNVWKLTSTPSILLCVCVCGMWEDRALRRIFGPKTEEVTGDWRKSHDEWLHYLYPSPNIVRALNERGWDGAVVCHGGVRGDIHVGFCWGNVKETDTLEDIDWDGRQILNWILRNETVWTFINSLRTGTNIELLWAW